MIYLFSINKNVYRFAGDYFYVDGKIFCYHDDSAYLIEFDSDVDDFLFYIVTEMDISVFKIKKKKYLTKELGLYDDIVSYNNRFKAILDREILNKIIKSI